jgi:hypothetical protein
MTTTQVADRLVTLCRSGQFEAAYQELYHPDIVSTEPAVFPDHVARGMEAVGAKSQAWIDDLIDMHELQVSDPVVGDDYFAVSMLIDMTTKSRGHSRSSEVCVYGVQNGKIVSEQFFYNATM